MQDSAHNRDKINVSIIIVEKLSNFLLDKPSRLPWHRPSSVAQGGRASLLILFEDVTFSLGPPGPLSLALPISAFVGL